MNNGCLDLINAKGQLEAKAELEKYERNRWSPDFNVPSIIEHLNYFDFCQLILPW
jgi:hypothetical protein